MNKRNSLIKKKTNVALSFLAFYQCFFVFVRTRLNSFQSVNRELFSATHTHVPFSVEFFGGDLLASAICVQRFSFVLFGRDFVHSAFVHTYKRIKLNVQYQYCNQE